MGPEILTACKKAGNNDDLETNGSDVTIEAVGA
jgi:hypothetical protein